MNTFSYKQGVFFSLFFNIISKGLLFLVNIFIAYFFGANTSTDIYFFLVSIIFLVSNILLGLTGSVLIPEFMRLEVTEGSLYAQSFVNRTYSQVMIVILIGSVLMFIWPVDFMIVISSFDHTTLQHQVALIRISLGVVILQSAVTLLNELLLSKKYFVIPPIIAVCNSILTISCVAFLYQTEGLMSIFMANIVALSISIIVQTIILIKFESWRMTIFSSSLPHGLKSDFAYAILSIAASSMAAFYPIYLLSKFSAALTEFNYAQKISEIPNTLIAIQFGSVMAIRFNEGFSRGRLEEVNSDFIKSTNTLLALLTPISIFVFFFSSKIALLFFFKSSLPSQSLANISIFISVLISATPFIGFSYLGAKILMAFRKVKEGVVLQVVMTLVNGCFVFVGVYLGGSVGYCLAYSLYQIVYAIGLSFFIERMLPNLKCVNIIKNVASVIGGSLLALLITIGISAFLEDKLNVMSFLGIVSSVYFVALLVINKFFKLNADILAFQDQILNRIILFLKIND